MTPLLSPFVLLVVPSVAVLFPLLLIVSLLLVSVVLVSFVVSFGVD
ncbi:MAG: hypothetical protein IIV45_07305 [Lachnospiraceae bacterium]|nr:hypothetical protein [Lachnospiraceae bacterium]